ncbi:FecR family protein [Steroidobacter sp.]|uniref:FecR family protein n=1 Tax=Steroidobacter sp. TaxID=1978227 RepID=UPI001A61D659|nr:FecR domain-containing protein [Steroidobacter sp.]MBL8270644.1 FecR domain-containing protein [Steroidobacter sp.]
MEQTEAAAQPTDAHLEQATQWFIRLREQGQVEDLPGLKTWLDADPLNQRAYQQVTAAWSALGEFSAAPEVMVGRRDALDSARRAARRRWSVGSGFGSRPAAIAAAVIVAVACTFGWLYSQRGVYSTDVGERRALTLEDGSVVTLDAKSRVRVHYEENQRLLSLERGQARFDVAKDPTRPFRVRAGEQTVIALGTQFNVELVGGNVLVSMIEGHVAITGVEPTVESATAPVELKAGEGVRVRASDGHAVVLPKIDVSKATAWQSGKMIFDNEPLSSAAERVNRYSQLQIVVDPAVADVGISGAFNTGDSNAFVEAVATYFAVRAEHTGAAKIRLTAPN